jgi:hypothetical protein
MLRKHAHNHWQMGGESIAELGLHKAKIEKQLSSSTLPTTCTIANSANFTYSGELEIGI